MDVIGAKILAGCIFFFLAFFFGWTPYFCFRRYFRQSRSRAGEQDNTRQPFLVQCLHSLASGVLLATSLLHLLPESLDAVKDAMSSKNKEKTILSYRNKNVTNFTAGEIEKLRNGQGQSDGDYFPVAECLVALGFLFIYMIDSAIKSCSKSEFSRRNLNYSTDDDDLSKASVHRVPRQYSTTQFTNADTSNKEHELLRRNLTDKTKLSFHFRWLRKLPTVTAAHEPAQGNNSKFLAEHETLTEPDMEDQHGLDTSLLQIKTSSESEKEASIRLSPSIEDHPLVTLKKPHISAKSSQLRSVALVSALCIHGFFDGVMMGLQTSLSVVTSLLIALSVHKSFVAIGLSLTLLASDKENVSSRFILLYVFLFASVAPVGLVASSAFLHKACDTSSETEISIVPGYLQAFAVGTFLYVTFTETTERHHRRNLLAVLVSHVFLLVGFGLMAGLRVAVRSK